MGYKNKKRILIVDDEPDVCNTLSNHLVRKGFVTEMAYNGKEALSAVKKKRPHLIILDVVMPKMDGFKVLEHLKTSSTYSGIPIIMLTKKSKPKYLGKGLNLSADFYLPKPFRLNNLLKFINLIL